MKYLVVNYLKKLAGYI